MRYRTVKDEGRLDKLLASRVGNLSIYIRKLLRLNIVPRHKYEVRIPDGHDNKEIENIAYDIRGTEYRPAIFIHGVLPRSGTNFLSDLIERHQDIYPHPHRFWEFPLLSITDHMMQLQNDFARTYPKNSEVLKPFEFAACLNSGLMRHLQEQVSPLKTMLFKFPYVHYIDLFRMFFPKDYLILLLRDGRDVVASSVKTYRKGLLRKRMADYCREWDCGARTILKYDSNRVVKNARTFVVRYENLFLDPDGCIRDILCKTGMELDRYDFRNLRDIPIRGSSELVEKTGEIDWKPRQRQGTFNPVGRWKAWSRHKKRKFKAISGDTLIAAGYEVSNEW